MSPVSRRDVLIAGGAALTGGVLGGAGVHFVANGGAGLAPGRPAAARVSVTEWAARRQAPYFIGHRGAGAVVPEHTLSSYLKALEWGAECLEISVVLSADGVLYCLHDLTLDRTTTLRGEARSRSSSELDLARVSIPRLGPRWTGQNMPPIPRLADVLTEVGRKAVLCIEPKDDAAYEPLVTLVDESGLKDTVIIKLDASSPRLRQARDAGFPLFAYLGNAEVATMERVDELAEFLDPARDVLVLPARADHVLMPSELFVAAAGTGIPVWVFPVHRRSEVAHFANLGVQGMITSSIGYTSGSIPRASVDDWASGQLSPGELTRNPYSSAFDLDWTEPAVLTIPTPGRQAFVTLGQFGPVEASSYRIAFDVCFDPLPEDGWQHVSIAFGRTDDRYYEHRQGDGDGYHALLRATGHLALYSHVSGVVDGTELVAPAQTPPLKRGVWSRLTLDVTPDTLRWSRDDGTAIEVRDSRFRGGYFHVGSSAVEGALRLRALTVS